MHLELMGNQAAAGLSESCAAARGGTGLLDCTQIKYFCKAE
jgi:hypothetical protein